MNIRAANEHDLPRLMDIFAQAKAFMRAHGNPHQWEDGYPSEDLMREEIRRGHCFVVETPADGPVATFCFSVGEGPTYARTAWPPTARPAAWHGSASRGAPHGPTTCGPTRTPTIS